MTEKKQASALRAADLRKELLADLGNLRGQFRDIIGRYQAELEAEMVKCINILSTAEVAEQARILNNAKKISGLAELIRDLKIKVHKGRLKDIERIDKVVEKISTALVKE